MKKFNNTNLTLVLFCIVPLLLLCASCKKYLDARPNITLETPSGLSDLQAILDRTSIFNQTDPQTPETASDNYYSTYKSFQAAILYDRSVYTWDTKTVYSSLDVDWTNAYRIIENANIVLDNLNTINSSASTSQYNSIKGSALFFRGFGFYNLAQIYSPPYNSSSASSPYGVCLRLTSGITTPSVRSTVQQTYNQMIQDLKAAINLLPVTTLFPTRPNKPSAYGVLSRIYLSMRDYNNAGLYADSCLQLQNQLMDYNKIIPHSSYSFQLFNAEVIFHTVSALRSISRHGIVDSTLFSEYNSNDLRKSLYYNSAGNFIGTYSGSDSEEYDGIASDEMYLTRAECFARNGNTQSALNDLNTLMVKRFKTGTFVPFPANSSHNALQLILTERRKELVYRNLRWMDLRRLNQDPTTAVTLTRNENGTIYTLMPNSSHYTFLIPQDVINVTNFQNNPY